ncbi:Uncharacterised protein [Chlamydia trachomatis]|nr:Uncharacterised protein [Chlamydia trachomatis]
MLVEQLGLVFYHQEKRYAASGHLVSYFLMRSEMIGTLLGKCIISIMEKKMLFIRWELHYLLAIV